METLRQMLTRTWRSAHMYSAGTANSYTCKWHSLFVFPRVKIYKYVDVLYRTFDPYSWADDHVELRLRIRGAS